MDITPFVEMLRQDLLAAATASGPEARETAERLGYALDPSARLAIMEAISQAAAEISAELPSGNVDVRLAGRELEFSVMLPPPPAPAAPPAPPEPDDEDDANVARVTLRIPESLKAKAEESASRAGQSLNTWLVNLVRAATRDGALNIDLDLSSIGPRIEEAMSRLDQFRQQGPHSGRRMTGWV